ncbi:MAG: GntR family transcriptional regulator [Angelakisella sp.]|nr:GntR family transcriptional regulator [Angelakisella sp.]
MGHKSNYRYEHIFEELQRDIVNKKYSVDSFLPSESEICAAFGVKRGTVRKALDMLVQEGLIEKVPGVGSKVTAPGHITQQPTAIKSSLASSEMRTIALVASDSSDNPRTLSQPFYADLFHHIEMECRKHNCQLIYASNTQDDALETFLNNHSFCSIVFVSRTSESSLKIANRCNVPIILVNERYKGYTSISYDGVQGGYSVIEHLVKNGHRNIGFITGPDTYFSSCDRLLGCYSAINAFGLTIPKTNYIAGNWEFQSGYECAKKLFMQYKPMDRPTAIFAFNDMMSIGAIKALQDMGYSVPDDVSVIGFDNMEELKFTHTNLTTVDTNIAELAKVIVRFASHTDFVSDLTGLKVKVDTTLIVRDTVKKIN